MTPPSDSKPKPAEQEPRDPFEFFESPWWQDAMKQLCADGWPMFVVPLSCMVRDSKAAYEAIKQERDEAVAQCTRLDNLARQIDVKAESLKIERDQLRAECEELKGKIMALELHAKTGGKSWGGAEVKRPVVYEDAAGVERTFPLNIRHVDYPEGDGL